MYTLAKLRAALVPVAVPLTCMEFSSLKAKLFSLMTSQGGKLMSWPKDSSAHFFQVPP